MQKYELMLAVWSVNDTEKSSKDIILSIKNKIEELWWEITFDDFWWIRKLAYQIQNNDNWYYQVFNFNIQWDCIIKLKSFINLNKNIIRYIVFKIDDKYKSLTKEELDILEKERYTELQEKKSNKRWHFWQQQWNTNKIKSDAPHVKPEVKSDDKPKIKDDFDSKINAIITDL